MNNVKIKKVLLVLCLAVFILWFLPTVIYSFDSYVGDYKKELIKEMTPNVYHLIFGGRKGDYEFISIPGAGWIFAIHLITTIFLLISVFDYTNNPWLDVIPAGLFVFLSSAFFSLASGSLKIGEVGDYKAYVNISVWGTILIYIVSVILCFGIFADQNLTTPSYENSNRAKQIKLNNVAKTAVPVVVDSIIKDKTKTKMEKSEELRKLYSSHKISKEEYVEAYKKL